MSASRYLWLAAATRACHWLDGHGRERAPEGGADARVAGWPQRTRRSLAAGAGGAGRCREQLRRIPAHRRCGPCAEGAGAAASRRSASRAGRRLSAVGDVPDAAPRQGARSRRGIPGTAARLSRLRGARCRAVPACPRLRSGRRPDAAMAALDELVTQLPAGRARGRGAVPARRGLLQRATIRRCRAGLRCGARASGRRARSTNRRCTSAAGHSSSWATTQRAAATFLALLDTLLVQGGQLRDAAQLTRPEQELSDDTLRALSLMFAADEGAASLQAALSQRGPAPYESRLYSALGDLYVEKERFQDGAEVYRSFARRQPLDPEAPFLLGKATEAYGKAGFTVARARVEAASWSNSTVPRSAYWAQRGVNIDPRVSAAVQANLLDLARHHHALAQKKGRGRGSRRGRALVPRVPRRLRCDGGGAGHAAAARRSPARRHALPDAADEYEKAAYNYPNARKPAAPAMPRWSRSTRRSRRCRRPNAPRCASGPSSRRCGSPARSRNMSKRPACSRGRPSSCSTRGDRERAEAVAQRVLALGTARRRRPAARGVDRARAHVLRLLTLCRGGARLRRDRRAHAGQRSTACGGRRAAAAVRLSPGRGAPGRRRHAGAVQDFLRVAGVAPASPIRSKAEFDAATLLLQAGSGRRQPRC